MTTLLILEDNAEMSKLYELVFSDYETCILRDVPDALVFLDRCVPDLVITDFKLPSGSGMDVLDYIRSHETLAKVPVLGVSIDDDVKHQAKQRGMNAFLIKPIEIRELRDTVEWLITGVKKPPVWATQMQESPAGAHEPEAIIAAVESTPPVEAEADITRRRVPIQPVVTAVPAESRSRFGRLFGKLRGA
jgi:DNA-binding response OmpR family regulator